MKTKIKRIINHRCTQILLVIIFSFNYSQAQNASITINNVNSNVMTNTKLLFGISFDSRTSLMGNGSTGLIGYYDSSGVIIPEIDSIFNDFPLSTLRYPANGIMNGFNWKKSIGPVNSRPNQDLYGTVCSPQPVKFGFDEFMSMTAAKGVPSSEIQIMVPIYDSAATGLTSTQAKASVPNVISHNADWVEYCNSPNDGNATNPGGGIDWAEIRAANGHPAPYGIKIWNIGNEPYTPNEYGSTNVNCNSFLNDVTPIINAMLAIDSTIKITIASTGNVSNPLSWSNTLLNSSLVASGKVYALSAHFFMTENSTNRHVSFVSTYIDNLNTIAATKGVKVFVGDYAHSIQNVNPTQAQQDSAMQWLGANLSADMLLMLSQKSTIERANFWVYGNAIATWHPIRKNSTGNYTSMPTAELYKILFPAFLDNSVNVTTNSPNAADGRYAIRSNAFVSQNLYQLNIVAVNRDRVNTIPFQVNGIAGYTINSATIYSAITNTSETIIQSIADTDSLGNFLMPPMSVLILEYTNATSGVDTTKFRTFKSSTELDTKVVKLKFKNGVLTGGLPNMATVVENVFRRGVTKEDNTFLGIEQTDKLLKKQFAWLFAKKGSEFGNFYATEHTQTAYPLDSTRVSGKKSKPLKNGIKLSNKYNNIGWAEGVMLRLNLIASQTKVTPENFGALVIDTSYILFGRNLQGMPLDALAGYMDSIMTYYATFNIGGENASSEYKTLTDFAYFLQRINSGFYSSLEPSNYHIDTANVMGGEKNKYAVTLWGTHSASDVGIVRRIIGRVAEPLVLHGRNSIIPELVQLEQNYPNPFNPTTTIEFSLPYASVVTLSVYNILGQEVSSLLLNQEMEYGEHEIEFDASLLPSGVYFYRLSADGIDEMHSGENSVVVRKMILMK